MNKAILSLLSMVGVFPLSLCQHRNHANHRSFSCVVTSSWKTDKDLALEDFTLTKHFKLFFFLIVIYCSSGYLKQQQQMVVEQKVLLVSHSS